ncbi:MAG: hypothetical protein ACREJD_02790 [Phycisphaerales bacterium]
MQTVYSRRFSFLGSSAALKAAGTLATIAALAGGVGCSSSPVAQAPMPVGSLAARDNSADLGIRPANPGIYSMAAGDRLGMAVYSRNIELARANSNERTRMAARPAAAASRPVIASADE